MIRGAAVVVDCAWFPLKIGHFEAAIATKTGRIRLLAEVEIVDRASLLRGVQLPEQGLRAREGGIQRQRLHDFGASFRA